MSALYAFRLFPTLFFSVPVASASSLAARTASNRSGFSSSIFCDALLTRFGSALPTAGIDEARNSWNGVATMKPLSSNHSVKERESSKELVTSKTFLPVLSLVLAMVTFSL